MNPPFNFLRAALLGAAVLATPLTSLAQTAIWKGPASGGEWNTDANWDLLLTPGVATNAFIAATTNVSYNLPMTAATLGVVTSRGTLNINTNGFNCTGIVLNGTGGSGKLFINTGAVVSVTGSVGFTSNNVVTLTAGSALNISGALYVGSGSAGGSGSGTVGSSGIMTNNGATLNAASTGLNIANQSVGTSCLLVINGGTNNLGNVTISRATGGNSAPPTLGTDGLVINNGVVTTTNISTASNSHQTMDVTGGVVTNLGSFKLSQPTSLRTARFIQSGGLFVNPTTNIISLLPTAATAVTIYQVTGGTNMVNGFQFGDTVPTAGITTFTIGAPIYVGAGGIASNGAVSLTASLNNGGKLGASADWTNGVTITLNGGVIDAQDVGGNPHNISSSGILKGSGALTKTGSGALILDAANTYSASTFINAGTLALGVNGSITNSLQVVVGSGTTFDVSAATSYSVFGGKTLAGFGVVTGNVAFAAAATLNAGSNAVTGILSFSNNLTQTGGAITHFDLSASPAGPNNDLVIVGGDLNIGGVSNLLEIAGGGTSGSVHPLFKYYGNFNGDLTNFTVVGPSGALTNDISVTPKQIAFVVTSAVRTATNVTWVGNAANNVWDVLNTTNWLNAGNLDYFVTSDNVTFGTAGLANSNVIIAASVAPASVSVNAAGDYVFDGPGSLGGLGGITKTNTGKLTIINTNNFSGGVSIKQGTVSVASLADDNTASPLGQTGALLLDGGTLEYTGPNMTWTRTLTLGSASGSVAIPSGITLAHSGSVAGTGPLIKANIGSLTLSAANSYSGGTLVNAGTLTLNNATAAGGGDITLNGGNLALGAVKPANSIIVAADAQVSGGNAGGLTGIKNITGSSNLVISVTAGVFDLIGDMAAYSGTITLANAGGAGVRLQGAIGSALATWDLGSSTMDLMIRSGSTLNNFGALKGSASTTLSGRGGSSNNGPTTHVIGAIGSDTTFDGAILNGAGGSSATTSIIKVGVGTLTLTGNNLYSGTTVVSNGVIALSGSGALAASSTITIVAGAAINTSARDDGTLVLGSTQTLRGNGTVRGSLDNTAGGKVAPGEAANTLGKLTITNVATLGGSILMDLNRTNAVFTNDTITAASIVLGGTLTVTNLGSTLVAGDRFVLFSGPITGSFSTVNLPENLGTVTYTWTNKTDIDGSIQVLTVTTVNQTPTNLVAVVNAGSLELSWPADHTGWRLQVQTNALTDGLGTNWVTIPGTDTSNGYTNAVDAANGAVFYRMVYP